ncbi:hypothetical protein BDN72DRAFT_907491 [Pluteus cervinus]|uniref:Uncharacterized protein n=1 Tax=Pluteus cervinus TaxID=181527 RepID=A0ACD2ZWQ5_9AGAR|nr:hypothetical protein BDN72DRAFT_907491 [Pluteus cervinus]
MTCYGVTQASAKLSPSQAQPRGSQAKFSLAELESSWELAGASFSPSCGNTSNSRSNTKNTEVAGPSAQINVLVPFSVQKHILPHTHSVAADYASYSRSCIPCTGFFDPRDSNFIALALIKGKVSEKEWFIFDNKHILWLPPHLRHNLLNHQIMIMSSDPMEEQIVAKLEYLCIWR